MFTHVRRCVWVTSPRLDVISPVCVRPGALSRSPDDCELAVPSGVFPVLHPRQVSVPLADQVLTQAQVPRNRAARPRRSPARERSFVLALRVGSDLTCVSALSLSQLPQCRPAPPSACPSPCPPAAPSPLLVPGSSSHPRAGGPLPTTLRGQQLGAGASAWGDTFPRPQANGLRCVRGSSFLAR